MNDQISFSSNRNSIQKFKVVLVGDQNVGKSSIIARYIRNEFDPTKNPTIGIDFISKNIAVTGKVVRLQLWDTAGQERFKSLIPSYLNDAHLAIVVFDLTNMGSAESLNKWIDFIREAGRAEIKIYVVGNKSDLEEEIEGDIRKYAKEIAEQQAEHYKEVSAKTASNIEQLFEDILEILLTPSKKTSKEESTVPDNAPKPKPNNNIQLGKPKEKEARQGGCCGSP